MPFYERRSAPCPKWHGSLANSCPSEFISEHGARHRGDWRVIRWDNSRELQPRSLTLLSGPYETLVTLFFSLIILSGNFKGPCKMGEAEKFLKKLPQLESSYANAAEQLCRAPSLRRLLWPRVFAQDRTMLCHLWSGVTYALFFLALTPLWKIQWNKVLVTAEAHVFTFICV